MIRAALLAFLLLDCTRSIATAGEPDRVWIIAPDFEMAAAFSAKFPGIRLGVLQHDVDESDETVNTRAMALRHATHLIFDPSVESLRLAMFRERLAVQGIIAIPRHVIFRSPPKVMRSGDFPRAAQHSNLLDSLASEGK